MKSFRGPITVGSQALEREFSKVRGHVYETIVEGALRLFSIAESKRSIHTVASEQPNCLMLLAGMIVDGIQEMSTEARQKLDEVIVSLAQAAKNGATLKPEEIKLTVGYFLNVSDAGFDTDRFSSWFGALMAVHTWLFGSEEYI
jgi:hypothetical protein